MSDQHDDLVPEDLRVEDATAGMAHYDEELMEEQDDQGVGRRGGEDGARPGSAGVGVGGNQDDDMMNAALLSYMKESFLPPPPGNDAQSGGASKDSNHSGSQHGMSTNNAAAGGNQGASQAQPSGPESSSSSSSFMPLPTLTSLPPLPPMARPRSGNASANASSEDATTDPALAGQGGPPASSSAAAAGNGAGEPARDANGQKLSDLDYSQSLLAIARAAHLAAASGQGGMTGGAGSASPTGSSAAAAARRTGSPLAPLLYGDASASEAAAAAAAAAGITISPGSAQLSSVGGKKRKPMVYKNKRTQVALSGGDADGSDPSNGKDEGSEAKRPRTASSGRRGRPPGKANVASAATSHLAAGGSGTGPDGEGASGTTLADAEQGRAPGVQGDNQAEEIAKAMSGADGSNDDPDAPRDQNGDLVEEDPKVKAARISKRAEQNRKAQQAFRRRRDAYIQQMQDQVREMDLLRAAAAETDRKYEEAKMAQEALRIENTILHSAILHAANQGTRFIDSHGEFLCLGTAREQPEAGTSAARDDNGGAPLQQAEDGSSSREEVQAALDALAAKTLVLARAGVPNVGAAAQ